MNGSFRSEQSPGCIELPFANSLDEFKTAGPGGGALGHPKVWYDMSEQDYVECKYCDRVFALKGGSHDPSPAGK